MKAFPKRPKPEEYGNFIANTNVNDYLHDLNLWFEEVAEKLEELMEEHEQIESPLARALNAELILKWILESLK